MANDLDDIEAFNLAGAAAGDNVAPPKEHDWGPSTVGHGNKQCRVCFCTDLEAAAVPSLKYCSNK